MKQVWRVLVLLAPLACMRLGDDLNYLREALTVDASFPQTVEIGKPLRIDFALRNRSGSPVEGCLGGSHGMRVLDGAKHSVHNVPSTSGLKCLAPFSLGPGEAVPLDTEFTVPPTLQPGPGRVSVGAYVLGSQCCSFIWIDSPWHAVSLEAGPQ